MANLKQFGGSIPVVVNRLAVTYTVVKKRFVKSDGAAAAGASDDSAGVAMFDGVSGDTMDCTDAGVVELELGTGGITIYGRVECDSSGRGVALASGRSRGKALAAGSAGDVVPVLLNGA